jgi:hypothetical protein
MAWRNPTIREDEGKLEWGDIRSKYFVRISHKLSFYYGSFFCTDWKSLFCANLKSQTTFSEPSNATTKR